MGKIFCLMGKSSSGKDTVFKKLLEEFKDRLKPVVTYTTRPKRKAEIEGKEYCFIDEETVQHYEKNGQLIEKRTYHTVDGDWTYCTVNDGQFALETHSYLLIGTLDVYQSLQVFFGEEAVVPLYLCIDDGVRLARALQRERQQAVPNYEELCRRFLADCVDFSDAQLAKRKIHHWYKNDNLSDCIDELNQTILAKLC